MPILLTGKTKKIGIVCSLLLLLMGGVVFFILLNEERLFSRAGRDEEAFYQELAEFDALLVKPEAFETPETLNRALDKLTRKGSGVEAYLSVLKRRRLLAQQDRRFLPAYRKAAQDAAEEIPFSEPLAALAAEALLLTRDTSLETEAKLRTYGARLSAGTLKPVALGVALILGDLNDPALAAAIPNKTALYTAGVPEIRLTNVAGVPETRLADAAGVPETRLTDAPNLDLVLDLVLLQILNGDTAGALVSITTLLNTPELVAQKPAIRRLAAEFFYDFDNPFRAAELFAQFSDERPLARQGDALWRAGYAKEARNIWTLLLAPKQSEPEPSNSIAKSRSLYNLAATTPNLDEKRANLQRFIETFPGIRSASDYAIYGIIGYSRLLDTFQAIQTLETAQTGNNLPLDLEVLRRRREAWGIDKTVAETWLLLNRYTKDPRIYQWACYYFDLQRRYGETARLINEAENQQIRGPWIDFHDALRLIREGNLDAAELKLKSITPLNYLWQIPANIARIMELKRDAVEAVSYYETAASLVKDKDAAGRIFFRISRCYQALGREEECRATLEQALQYNPQYLEARLELQRALFSQPTP